MLSFISGFIVYVIAVFIVAALLEIPPKVALFGFAIGVWWLFF